MLRYMQSVTGFITPLLTFRSYRNLNVSVRVANPDRHRGRGLNQALVAKATLTVYLIPLT